MKATYYETWGVHLGWSQPFMGGVLVKFAGGRVEWHFSHTNVLEMLERGGHPTI